MLPYGLGFWEIAFVIVIALIILACIIGAIFLIVWAFRRSGSSTPVTPGMGRQGGSAALQIAQERYARGEINRDEYLQIVSDIQKQA
jgi:putative membrane protein